MRWTRSGEIWILRSKGWVRAILILSGTVPAKRGGSYCCVTTSADGSVVREFIGGNINKLKQDVVAHLRGDW